MKNFTFYMLASDRSYDEFHLVIIQCGYQFLFKKNNAENIFISKYDLTKPYFNRTL
jgi:hypothetical protein